MSFLSPSETEVRIYKNDLKTFRYPAESCDHDLAADTVRTLAVKTASVFHTRSINTESLCVDRRRLISCPVHGILFCLDDLDRKSTRLNSSHVSISYAVFCL